VSSAPRGEGQAISPVGDNAGPAFGGASVGEPSRKQVLLHLDGIGKSYSGVWVLRDVGFSLAAGEVLMLVGENGAGKSTLKNILCGLVAPDAGTIRFRNEPHARMSTAEASALGIGAIHQELSLFPNLSVAENVFIDALPIRHGLVDVGEMRSACGLLLNDLFGPGIDPGAPLDHLSLGERQLVEIVKAVRRASTLLILDEPTASLSIPARAGRGRRPTGGWSGRGVDLVASSRHLSLGFRAPRGSLHHPVQLPGDSRSVLKDRHWSRERQGSA